MNEIKSKTFPFCGMKFSFGKEEHTKRNGLMKVLIEREVVSIIKTSRRKN
jgi:hypothetical protein